MGRDAIVETRALTKSYGAVRGIDGLDLDVVRGEVFGFIGPNGAGKTTTIRLLLDLIRPTSGSASIFGLDVHQSAVEIHARIGYLPGDLELFDRISAGELFAWLARLRRSRSVPHALALAERLDLDCSRRIADLSTGNRQKVGLVQALMDRPELLILDEPTSGLDPLVRREFRDIVTDVKDEGATVFLSSHVLDEVEDVCDRVGMIVNGRLRRVETIEDLHAWSSRHMRIVFAGAVDPAPFDHRPEVSGLVVDPASTVDRTVIELDVTGPPGAVLELATDHDVLDLVSEPRSLEDVFLSSYDGSEPGEEVTDDGRTEPVAARR